MIVLAASITRAINKWEGTKNMRTNPAQALTYIALLALCLSVIDAQPTIAKPTQQQLNATFLKFVEEIRKECGLKHPVDNQKYKVCGETKHKAMLSFFEKLYYYRDNQGLRSKGFQAGTDCLNKYSPKEPNGKVAAERADWIAVNNCYQEAIQ